MCSGGWSQCPFRCRVCDKPVLEHQVVCGECSQRDYDLGCQELANEILNEGEKK